MAVAEAKTIRTQEYPASRIFLTFQILLRLLAGATALASALIMATNTKTTSLFGIPVVAKYSYSASFRYFVAANSIALVYSVSSVLFMLKSSCSKAKSHFIVTFLDLTMALLLISACSAATAVAYIAKNGNQHAGWLAVCDYLGSYCSKGGLSLAFSYAAFLVFFLLSAITIKGPWQISVVSYQ